jgi:DNA-binding response OmpR family regulator
VSEGAANRILIVDDDGDFLDVAARILQGAGYTTLEAGTGGEALELARRHRPKLVVLDVRLQGAMSGHEVCRILKEELRPPPAVLFVSGARTESYDRVGGLLIGADDYIVKPFAADELLARVRALLRRSGPATSGGASLTTDELEVVKLLKDGFSQQDIARRLQVSRSTAQQQIEQILAKLGV